MNHRQLGLPDRIWMRAILLALGLLCLLGQPAIAQDFGPVIRIPVEKVRETYATNNEAGTRKYCGVRLYGEWPAYLNYTNLSSYINLKDGLAGVTPSFQSQTVPVGGRFRFYTYFNGTDTTDLNAICPTEIGNTLPDWYVEIYRRGPTASFTNRALPPVAGDIEFTSTSTDPEDQPLIEQWVFGDESSGSGHKEIHRYTKPGSFTAALTVRDTDGLTNRATRSISVPAPKPVVSVRLFNKHSGNRIELEETFGVRVTVQATTDGVGALSNLAFTGPPLSIPEIFTIVSAPTETPIGTLQPGDPPREFNWTLKADKVGQFALTTSGVLGKDAADRTVSGAADTARGEVTSLIVGIEQRPPRLVLGADNNNDGKTNELDMRFELIIGITNVSKQNITDVKAVIVDDPIQIHALDDRVDIWGTRLVATNVPPGDFGTITPGAENAVLRTNVYVAVGERIYAEASILLQGKAGEAGVQERGEGIVNVGGGTLLEARFDVEERPYKAGQLVRVFGSLKNVSKLRSTRGQVVDEGKTIGVVVYPRILGNGVGGFVVRKDSGGQTPKGPTPFVLAPDETIDITAIVPTLEIEAHTWLTLDYEVRAFVFGEGPKPRPATPFEVEVVEKAPDLEKPNERWSRRHHVELAGVPPVFAPCPECRTDLSQPIPLSCCLSQGLYNFGGFAIETAALAAGTGWEYFLLTQRLRAWKQWVLWQTIQALLGGDEAARQRLASEIENDVNALKVSGVQSLQDIDRIGDLILPAMARALNDTEAVLQTGDLNLVAAYFVKAAGENPDMVLDGIVAARTTYRTLAAIREASQDVAAIALRESLQKQKDELPGLVEEFAAKHGGDLSRFPESDDLPVGIDAYNMPRIYRDAHGVSKRTVDAILAVCEKHGVVIPFRSRSPLSQAKIDAGTHLPKPGGVPAKNISDLDRKYGGVPEKYEGEVALAQPPIHTHPDDPDFEKKVQEYLDKLPELKGDDDFVRNERALAEERLKFQLEEWPKQLENFQKYEREGIDVDFHAQKQGIELGKDELAEFLLENSGVKRGARVLKEEFTDRFGTKRVVYILQMETAPGSKIFKGITGDIDFLGVFMPDGSLPSLAIRLLVYRDLRILGLLEHGESFTFYLKHLRETFLRCCTPKSMGGKGTKMLAGTPTGKLLTTQFVDNLSIVEGGINNALKVGDDEFAFLAGTMTETFSKKFAILDTPILKTVSREVANVTASVIARLVSELKHMT